MHRLITKAKQTVDQAELYWKRERNLSVRYENYNLAQIVENDLSSVALRVIDHGKSGATFGVSPDQENLLEQAKQAAQYGDKASSSFASNAAYPEVANHDPATTALTSDDLVALCEDVKAKVRKVRPDVALFLAAEASTTQLVVETTEGAVGDNTATEASVVFGAPIKGAGMGVYKAAESISPQTTPEDLIADFDEWYGWTEKTSTPSTGKLPVLFAPEASFLYLLPLACGLAGGAIVKKTSPLVDRVGAQTLSDKLTILDDPLRDGDSASRPFDDEGTPCQRRILIDRGVLTGYLLDQSTGQALGVPSTGNAVKRELFGGGTETSPSPWPINFVVEQGEVSYRDLIADLDEGLLITHGLGFHSGNYPQGQFSVQAVGYHIVNGKVVGRLIKTMISANIYEDFKNVRALSSEHRAGMMGLLGGITPYILVDAIQVAGA